MNIKRIPIKNLDDSQTMAIDDYRKAMAKKKKKANKYRVSSKERRTYKSIVFHSREEMKRYIVLMNREKLGLIMELELQPVYELKHLVTTPCDSFPTTYTERAIMDFAYFDLEAEESVIEDVKGHDTRDSKRKRKLVEAVYGVKIKIVKKAGDL